MAFKDLVKKYNEQFEDDVDYIEGDDTELIYAVTDECSVEDEDGTEYDIKIVGEKVGYLDVDKCSVDKDIIFTVDDKCYYHVAVNENSNGCESTKITPVTFKEETRTVKVITDKNGNEYLV